MMEQSLQQGMQVWELAGFQMELFDVLPNAHFDNQTKTIDLLISNNSIFLLWYSNMSNM